MASSATTSAMSTIPTGVRSPYASYPVSAYLVDSDGDTGFDNHYVTRSYGFRRTRTAPATLGELIQVVTYMMTIAKVLAFPTAKLRRARVGSSTLGVFSILASSTSTTTVASTTIPTGEDRRIRIWADLKV